MSLCQYSHMYKSGKSVTLSVQLSSYMILPSEGIVDVARLSRIYDNTTATYKFYWFVSIINLISANPDRRVFSFEEIIAGMIADAWYPIHFFRLSFGKLDSLESNIFEIQRILDIPIDANKDVVRETILKNKVHVECPISFSFTVDSEGHKCSS